MDQSHDHILTLAAQIVSAHVGHNDTPTEALPGLIRDVYKSLLAAEPQDSAPPPSTAVARVAQVATASRGPAARQTVFSDRLTCLECGLTMKMLKRHLITVHNLSPDQYRQKFNLPSNYALNLPVLRVTPLANRYKRRAARPAG